MEERKQREGEIQRKEGRKAGRDALPMPPVSWTPSRLAKSRAPLVCQKHACKSVAAAARAITAFAHAKKPESYFIGHWLYHLDPRFSQDIGTDSFLLGPLSKMTIK